MMLGRKIDRYWVDGLDALYKSIERLGKVPQRCVTKAAKSGATISRKAAKKGGWIDRTGNLRKGIILKGERSRVTGKKVYDTMMDPAMNNIFQKATKSGMRRMTEGKRTTTAKGNYYYPASQEFGFMAVYGRFIPGFHFLRDSVADNSKEISGKMVSVLSKEIDKELNKK